MTALQYRSYVVRFPRNVTAAVVLLAAEGIMGIAGLVLSLLARAPVAEAPVTAQSISRLLVGGLTTVTMAGVATSILLSMTTLILATLILGGDEPARRCARLLSAAAVLAFCAATLAGGPVSRPEPQWYVEYSVIATVLALAAHLAIVVLLRPRATRGQPAS